MLPWLPTGERAHTTPMGFDITLRDHSTESVGDADTYVHEKAMTTFYRTNNARRAVDCWSVPVASVRTDEILMIKVAAEPGANSTDVDAAADIADNVVVLQSA